MTYLNENMICMGHAILNPSNGLAFHSISDNFISGIWGRRQSSIGRITVPTSWRALNFYDTPQYTFVHQHNRVCYTYKVMFYFMKLNLTVIYNKLLFLHTTNVISARKTKRIFFELPIPMIFQKLSRNMRLTYISR